MAVVTQGEATSRGHGRRFGRRVLPATLATGLVLTGIAAAGRTAPDTVARTEALAPADTAPTGTVAPWAALPAPTSTPAPTATPGVPTPTPAPTATATPAPTATPTPTPVPELGPVLEALVADLDPNRTGTVSITVIHDGDVDSIRGDEATVSASAAKLYWTVAAAARTDDIAALADEAAAVFGRSDNEAAGRLIDAAGGVDAVNAYTAALGMGDTSLSAWAYGANRLATDRADRGNENRTSTDDLATFLDLFAGGSLLGPDDQETVEAWMRLTPDDLASSAGLDGLLADQLPASVAAQTMHKAGWLPPGCCSVIDHVLVVGGVVPLPDGGSFSIAVAAENAPNFAAAVDWIPTVVCEVYRVLGEPVACAQP